MPLYQYQCANCGLEQERLVFASDSTGPMCEQCATQLTDEMKLPTSASFKIKGLRASNGYGLKFQDTPGRSKVDDFETGYSFHSTKDPAGVDRNHRDSQHLRQKGDGAKGKGPKRGKTNELIVPGQPAPADAKPIKEVHIEEA